MNVYQQPKIEVAPHAEDFQDNLGSFPGGFSPSSTACVSSLDNSGGIFCTPARTFVANAVFIAPDPVMAGNIEVGVCCHMCGAVHKTSLSGTCADRGEPLPVQLCQTFRSSFHNVAVYVVLHPVFRPGGKLDRHALNAEYEKVVRDFLGKWEQGARTEREAIRNFEVIIQNAENFQKAKLDERYTA